jgi:hypothetical protein
LKPWAAGFSARPENANRMLDEPIFVDHAWARCRAIWKSGRTEWHAIDRNP